VSWRPLPRSFECVKALPLIYKPRMCLNAPGPCSAAAYGSAAVFRLRAASYLNAKKLKKKGKKPNADQVGAAAAAVTSLSSCILALGLLGSCLSAAPPVPADTALCAGRCQQCKYNIVCKVERADTAAVTPASLYVRLCSSFFMPAMQCVLQLCCCICTAGMCPASLEHTQCYTAMTFWV
jgi:hypothetical protein